MSQQTALTPAADLAANHKTTYPNETAEYRSARNALLAEEIELRRHIEQVAAQRRDLPPGGEIPEDYEFESESGPLRMSDLFGEKPTLIVYSFMYGPKRQQACPVCTSMLSAWNGSAANVHPRAALAVIARSPIERLLDIKTERGWQNLHLYSDRQGAYTRTYVSAEDADMPALHVFTRMKGKIHHFWSSEMGPETSDPGQDPRGAPDIDPLWTILDMTPEGRGANYYPKLDHRPEPLVTLR